MKTTYKLSSMESATEQWLRVLFARQKSDDFDLDEMVQFDKSYDTYKFISSTMMETLKISTWAGHKHSFNRTLLDFFV